MTQFLTFAPLLARIFLGLIFIGAGMSKIGNVEGFAGYMASGGIPAILAWPAIIFEIALGLSMLAGFQTRIMALLGAAFCVVTALLYHLQPEDQMQMQAFFKNLGVAGAFLMLATHGPGRLAVDRPAQA